MTTSQEKAINNIKRLAEKLLYSDNYEIKSFEIEENDYFISVVVETGMKGDEGTLAAALARDRAHMFIGKRGGITYPVYKNGKSYTKRFEGATLLQIVCDQQ